MAVTVKTPARLHLGQIDLNGSLQRIFGGMGVAIERPGVELEVHPGRRLVVAGEQSLKVKALARQFLNHFGLNQGAYIYVRKAIPEHVGLGSGTQLALAVGRALAELNNLEVAVDELAKVMDRGDSRSGIGIGVFKHGGFIVDGGRKSTFGGPGDGNSRYVPPVIVRHAFPDSWRFIVAIPDQLRGLSGRAEKAAFRRLPPMPPEKVGEICRYLVMKMLPAIVEEDICGFGQALTEIQRILGDYFSPVQKGTFADDLLARLAGFMIASGAESAGQSSWGPTVYGLVHQSVARDLEAGVKEFLQGRGTVFCTRVVNEGARLEVNSMGLRSRVAVRR